MELKYWDFDNFIRFFLFRSICIIWEGFQALKILGFHVQLMPWALHMCTHIILICQCRILHWLSSKRLEALKYNGSRASTFCILSNLIYHFCNVRSGNFGQKMLETVRHMCGLMVDTIFIGAVKRLKGGKKAVFWLYRFRL